MSVAAPMRITPPAVSRPTRPRLRRRRLRRPSLWTRRRQQGYQELPLFPLNVVLFPQMPLPLHIFEERYKILINRCLQEGAPFGVVQLTEGAAEATTKS
jgi:hypothetical protein